MVMAAQSAIARESGGRPFPTEYRLGAHEISCAVTDNSPGNCARLGLFGMKSAEEANSAPGDTTAFRRQATGTITRPAATATRTHVRCCRSVSKPASRQAAAEIRDASASRERAVRGAILSSTPR